MKYLKHFRILGSCLISPSDFLMKKELYDLLGSYEDVLNNGIGMSNSGSQKFTIEVDPSVLPIRSYAFRMPEDKRRLLRQQVEEHILEGRVRPSRSAWASRAFSLSKKEPVLGFDSYRMVSIGTRSYKHSVGNIVNRLIMLHGSTLFGSIVSRWTECARDGAAFGPT